ncbi:DUF2953 domain-containing protein [Bacillus kwashiorkori]|uniref:DUF2953 domain-containing protein n=1 Tax=Bacillus kwashiorkori TaxID=1522318 RepID=UPI0007826022|nr:DUF2953 domain-containing protein [Bacillus kwashiorkori]
MVWLIIIVALILLLLVVIFSKVKLKVTYSHANSKDLLQIVVILLFGIIKFKINLLDGKNKDDQPEQQNNNDQMAKQQDVEDSGLKSLHDIKLVVNRVIGLNKIVQTFLKKVQIIKFDWKTVIGTGDASQTGMITGVAWGIKGVVVGLLSKFFSLKVYPNIHIAPSFQQKIAKTELFCMIQVRIGHAILAGIKILKYWRGSKPKFKSKPLTKLNMQKDEHTAQ